MDAADQEANAVRNSQSEILLRNLFFAAVDVNLTHVTPTRLTNNQAESKFILRRERFTEEEVVQIDVVSRQ